MAELSWDQVGDRFYESGIDRVVLYPRDVPAVAWTGVTAVEEKLVGGDIKPYYVDGVKIIDFAETSVFQATLSAFFAPREFLACDGALPLMKGLYLTQQQRQHFGLSYRTLIANDVGSVGYKIHVVYNALASPANREHRTISNSSDPEKRSWTIDAIPEKITNRKPTAHMVINTTRYSSTKIQNLENKLYGTSSTSPVLPSPSEIITILGAP